jgi:UDP-N-acetylmuramate dehydrogenase
VLTRAGEVRTHQRGDMRFAYRHSSLDELVILSAVFELEPEDPSILTKRMQKMWIIQKSHQPGGAHGVGRIFKDPGGASAAQLIEQAGLKGAAEGKAAIHDRRPNYIVTTPGATCHDVLRLIEMVQSRVAEQLGVELETDINIW